MGRTNSSRLRYNLFKRISLKTWQRVADAHRVGIDLDEKGITADIIVGILTFHDKYKYKKWKIPMGLFAAKGQNEHIYGSDIDIFLEVEKDKYIWFALQAKLLKVSDIYDKLAYKSQWEKLADLEKESGCKAYYLLYNGQSDYSTKKLKDICGNLFKMTHFGCSLVEPDFVGKQVVLGRKSFKDFHDTPAQPWHVIMTCPMVLFKSTPKYYTEKNIIQGAKTMKYEQLFKTGIELKYEDVEINGDNPIAKALKEADRTSSTILMIKN